LAVVQSHSNLLSNGFSDQILLISLGVVCGLAFVLHELAHRMSPATRCPGHFVANNGWLLISIVNRLRRILSLPPPRREPVCATVVPGRARAGLIALAGPLTNMVPRGALFHRADRLLIR